VHSCVLFTARLAATPQCQSSCQIAATPLVGQQIEPAACPINRPCCCNLRSRSRVACCLCSKLEVDPRCIAFSAMPGAPTQTGGTGQPTALGRKRGPVQQHRWCSGIGVVQISKNMARCQGWSPGKFGNGKRNPSRYTAAPPVLLHRPARPSSRVPCPVPPV
jgi:hypothetical protein